MTNESWIAVNDPAQHLGIAKDSNYRWLDHKELPAQLRAALSRGSKRDLVP